MAFTGSDSVKHPQAFAVQYGVLAYTNGGGKVAERLEVVLQITASLVEQVVIDGAFLVNGNQLPKLTLADPESFGGNLHHRPALHLEDIIHPIGLRTVATGCRYLGKQTILFLIPRAYALQSMREAG